MATSVTSMFTAVEATVGPVIGFADVGLRSLSPVAPVTVPDAVLPDQLDSLSSFTKFLPGGFTSVSVFTL